MILLKRFKAYLKILETSYELEMISQRFSVLLKESDSGGVLSVLAFIAIKGEYTELLINQHMGGNR